MTEQTNFVQSAPADETQDVGGITLHDILRMVIANWYWFALSMIVCVALGYFYLASTPRIYSRTATILIKDSRKGGDIEMTAAQAASGFRFYAELGKWGDNGALPSVGSNPNDGDNATVVLEDGKYTGPCVKGKGNWNITNWPGGKMHIEVDMSNVNSMTVTFSEPKK